MFVVAMQRRNKNQISMIYTPFQLDYFHFRSINAQAFHLENQNVLWPLSMPVDDQMRSFSALNIIHTEWYMLLVLFVHSCGINLKSDVKTNVFLFGKCIVVHKNPFDVQSLLNSNHRIVYHNSNLSHKFAFLFMHPPFDVFFSLVPQWTCAFICTILIFSLAAVTKCNMIWFVGVLLLFYLRIYMYIFSSVSLFSRYFRKKSLLHLCSTHGFHIYKYSNISKQSK